MSTPNTVAVIKLIENSSEPVSDANETKLIQKAGTLAVSSNGSSFAAPSAGNATTADGPTDASEFSDDLGVSIGAWAAARRAEALAVIPELTRFKVIDSINYGPSSTAPTFDGSVEGGAMSPLANGNAIYFSRSFAQTVKTGKGCIIFRAKFLVPGVGNESAIGVINAAASHIVSIDRVPNATSTHYRFRAVGAGTTVQNGSATADTAWHNFMLIWNGTNIRIYLDNTLDNTVTDLSNVNDEAMSAYMLNTESTDVFIQHAMIGYVAV
jgi:hypothetical protein